MFKYLPKFFLCKAGQVKKKERNGSGQTNGRIRKGILMKRGSV
jgi:hypothetical protein